MLVAATREPALEVSQGRAGPPLADSRACARRGRRVCRRHARLPDDAAELAAERAFQAGVQPACEPDLGRLEPRLEPRSSTAVSERWDGVLVEHVAFEAVAHRLLHAASGSTSSSASSRSPKRWRAPPRSSHEDTRMVASRHGSGRTAAAMFRPHARLGARDRRPGRRQPERHAARGGAHAGRGLGERSAARDARARRPGHARRRRPHAGHGLVGRRRHDARVHGHAARPRCRAARRDTEFAGVAAMKMLGLRRDPPLARGRGRGRRPSASRAGRSSRSTTRSPAARPSATCWPATSRARGTWRRATRVPPAGSASPWRHPDRV